LQFVVVVPSKDVLKNGKDFLGAHLAGCPSPGCGPACFQFPKPLPLKLKLLNFVTVPEQSFLCV